MDIELDRLGDEIAELSAHLVAATARLLAVGRAGTAAHVERIVRDWCRVDRQAEAREAARQHAGRALHVYEDEDGTGVIRGRLAPEVGALLLRALDAARETLYQRARHPDGAPPAAAGSMEAPTRVRQQADALALLAETALHHALDPGAPGERYQVVVLRECHDSHGLRLNARTACPGWLGERLDVGWAIGVLHPRADSMNSA